MAKKRSQFQNLAELAAMRIVFGAVGFLSLEGSMNFGKRVGRFLGTRLKKLQRTARRNLEIAFPGMPEDEKARLIEGTFESLGRHLGFATHLSKFTHEDVRSLVEIVGEENFFKARESGKGILFFTGHFGSWEVFNLLPPAFGFQMNILVRRIDNPLVEKFVDSFRTRFGSVTLDKTKSARRMYRVLEEGGLLGILADLNAQEREGVFVDFFGVPASTTMSIAKLALATDAVVLPAFAVWDEEKKKYVVHLEPPVEYAKTDDHQRDIRDLTASVTAIVERYVRAYPEQWLWIHKRWNTRPKGERGLY